jgi:hypothetical protein
MDLFHPGALVFFGATAGSILVIFGNAPYLTPCGPVKTSFSACGIHVACNALIVEGSDRFRMPESASAGARGWDEAGHA